MTEHTTPTSIPLPHHLAKDVHSEKRIVVADVDTTTGDPTIALDLIDGENQTELGWFPLDAITRNLRPILQKTTGEDLYTSHGWSGCAGSEWSNLPPAVQQGWNFAASLGISARQDATDHLESEINRLRDALSSNSDEVLCHCVTEGPAIDGPLEDCLTHGRTKSELWEMLAAANERADNAEQRAEKADASVKELEGEALPADHPALAVSDKEGYERGWDAAVAEFKPENERLRAEIDRLDGELRGTQEEFARVLTANQNLTTSLAEVRRTARQGEATRQLLYLAKETEATIVLDGVRIEPVKES
jgi:hypothetical protein